MENRATEMSNIVQKSFTFEEYEDPKQSLNVSIPEVLDPQYGMHVWPCAVVLAQYVWTHREELMHKTVLELGAGVSLPGVVAAKCGAQVILSDSAELPLCLENCRRTCEVNELPNVLVVGITWGEVSPDLLLLPPLDIILGSDVFYEPQDFENVLVTISFLLRKNPEAQFWTTYQERSADWSIEALLHKWNLKCLNIPLEKFHANKDQLAGSTLPGSHTVQMIITEDKES
ncbi:methyltransferase-like protein 23 isoform X1 [Oncorhynchus mykiss]|uniref:Methyltransferase 23, arginine n=2 Tax=Oncorhynchus mykiss TaxID=8022 RepID=A0A8C7SC15_ONCMY|nr:methyltransferase-like protein 23 isoform X1 [Oncorhynchus mykiss]XP_046186881.1 methyltransferase-like protein 23 [Oncorhynchus gorbuscha]